jgi:glycosyltransferase involved in cell wall biosynthesis
MSARDPLRADPLASRSRRVYLISAAFQEDYEVGFANGLHRNGVTVTVIGSRKTLTSRLDPGVDFMDLRGDQDPGRGAMAKLANMLRYFAALARLGRAERRAIFHTNGIFALRRGWGALFEAVLSRLAFREWWLTVHNVLPHDEESWTNRLAFGAAYSLADTLFVHTEATAGELCSRFGIDRARVRVVEHGIDRFVEPDPTSKAHVRQKFALPEFRILLLVFGNVSPYKGVDLLLDAVDRTTLPPDVVVLIAGRSSSDSYRRLLAARLARNRNARQVIWVDEYIPDAEMPHLLAAADCMILPYRKIDQSGVMFAAKSAGVPVVASDVGSFRSYVNPDCDLLVPPGDVDALAQTLALVARRGPTGSRAVLTSAARRRYAWEVTLRGYADLVRTC